MIEDALREEMMAFKKEFLNKQKKIMLGLGVFFAVVLCVVVSNFVGETNFKVFAVCVLAVAVSMLYAYFTSTQEYRCIKPNNLHYITSSFSMKDFKRGHVDYDDVGLNGNPRKYPDRYYVRIQGENFNRKTFKWVYNDVQVDKSYVIVFSGIPESKRSKVVYIKEVA